MCDYRLPAVKRVDLLFHKHENVQPAETPSAEKNKDNIPNILQLPVQTNPNTPPALKPSNKHPRYLVYLSRAKTLGGKCVCWGLWSLWD